MGLKKPTAGIGLDQLSAREEQVLSLAAEGLVDKQIAANLAVSENTLRTYWRRIRLKLGEAPRSALAADYARRRAAQDLEDEGAWTFYIDRRMVHYHGDRDVLPLGETTYEEAIKAFYPGDRDRMARLVEQLAQYDVPPITVLVRIMTARGVQTVCTRLEPVRDNRGKVVAIVGRPAPLLDLTSDSSPPARFGTYRRDLDTDEVEIDEGFREIYRIDPEEKDIRAAVLRTHCASSRKKMAGMVEAMIATGSGRRRWAVSLCFPNGEQVWVSGQSFLEERGGRPIAFIAQVVSFPRGEARISEGSRT